jgi:hypothetical protein
MYQGCVQERRLDMKDMFTETNATVIHPRIAKKNVDFSPNKEQDGTSIPKIDAL